MKALKFIDQMDLVKKLRYANRMIKHYKLNSLNLLSPSSPYKNEGSSTLSKNKTEIPSRLGRYGSVQGLRIQKFKEEASKITEEESPQNKVNDEYYHKSKENLPLISSV